MEEREAARLCCWELTPLGLVFQHSLVKRAWARFCLSRAPGRGYRAHGVVSSERTKGYVCPWKDIRLMLLISCLG